jgi:hypothetical protein
MGGGWGSEVVRSEEVKIVDMGGGMNRESGNAFQENLRSYDQVLYGKLADRRMTFNLVLTSGRVSRMSGLQNTRWLSIGLWCRERLSPCPMLPSWSL